MTHSVQPAELNIPTLPAVLDPRELGKHLNLSFSPLWNWRELRGVWVQRLKSSHRNRRTVEIRVHTTDAFHTLIGKVYAEDRSEVYRAMDSIARAGFGPHAEFPNPQLLGVQHD